MQSEVEQLYLLLSTSNNNEEVQHATERLNELSQQPEFIESLFSIALNNTNMKLKAMVLIRLQKELILHYDEIPGIHESLITNLPQLIVSFANQHDDIVSYYAQVVIENALRTGEYPNILTDIEQYIQDPNLIKVALMYAKAASSFVGNNETEDGQLNGLTEPLINMLISITESIDDQTVLASLFDCFHSIILNSKLQFFNQNFGAFQPILSKFMTLEDITTTEQYKMFSKTATDFITTFMDRYLTSLDDQTISILITLIQNMLRSGVCSNYVKANLLHTLHTLFKKDDTFETFIQESAAEFLTETMFPQFQVSVQELAAAVEDPKAFIDELHKSSGDYNDFRETAFLIIKDLAEKMDNDIPRDIIFEFVVQQISVFGQSSETDQDIANLFTTAFFFSAAADSYALYENRLLTKLINEVSPLFSHESEVVKAAGFLMVSRIHADLPTDLSISCLQCANDESHLVRYYALTAAANLLEKLTDESSDAIQGELEDSIDDLISSFIETCNEFEDVALKSCLTQIVRFFGDRLLPYADAICQELISMIAASGQGEIEDEDAYNNVMKVNQSLENLVEMVSDRADALNEFAQNAFMRSIEALQVMTNPNAVDPFLETVFQILECCSTFPAEFWKITEAIVPHFTHDEDPDGDFSVGACCEIFSLLILKDTEFANRAEVAGPVVEFVVSQMQQKMERVDSWNEFAKLFEGICVRLPSDSPILMECFPLICQMTFHQLTTINTAYNDIDGAVLLMNALLINNFAGVQQVLGEQFDTLMQLWVQWPVFPETEVAMMTNFQAISDNAELQGAILHSCIMNLCDDILMKDEDDDEFDQDVDKDGLVWFDFGDTLNSIDQFLKQLQQSQPDIYQTVKNMYEEEQFQDLERLPSIAQKYIETRDSKVKSQE